MTSLSKSQRLAIAKAFESHGISIKKEELTSLFDFVEHAIEGHRSSESFFDEAAKKKMLEVSRAQVYREIEHLRGSLERLSLSSAYILRITCAREPELNSMLNNIAKEIEKDLPLTMVLVVMRAIQNACESILSGREKYDPAWVASNGRPQDRRKHALVRKLAMAFERWTGRKATVTESGPFDDFLSACLTACNLNGVGTNRKLIRAALHNQTGHVKSLNLAKFSDVSGHS